MSSQSGATAAVPSLETYPFLAQPPPEKKQPYGSHDAPSYTQSENSRRRSLAAISNWATNVQPGAPAPLSPNKTTFSDAPRSSRHGRRHSTQMVQPVAPPAPLHYLPESPTSSEGTVTGAMKQDLQTVGYTSVIVQLPNTPPPNLDQTHHDEPENARGKRRFKSLSIKPPSRSKPIPSPLPTPKASNSTSRSSTTKDKKSKYAEERPALLAQELALMQFMGGGKVEHHMKQSAEKQAKKAGAVKGKNGQLVGVAPVWQDGQGGIWRDQEEEVEYAHLLGPTERRDTSGDAPWVQFDGRRGATGRGHRRGSASTQDSDLRTPPDFNVDVFASGHSSRRRPQPLDLVSPHDRNTEDLRREFLQASFVPGNVRRGDTLPSEPAVAPKKSVISNVKGIFKSKKSKAT
ncbi:hypothetical protein BDY19DRAFT_904198 [Irpex rosettiformis]|uniref:Uncharacterized protein n=1 Tax=Irpex rosettiformis TaxID=378272 RepID=A0ACB8UBA7_9APHY|nr:hypothetical protein BDY19DRAFT_904198 [Irpex rosettiformis]